MLLTVRLGGLRKGLMGDKLCAWLLGESRRVSKVKDG